MAKLFCDEKKGDMNFFWAKIRGAKTILAVKKGGRTLFFGDKMGGRNFFYQGKIL